MLHGLTANPLHLLSICHICLPAPQFNRIKEQEGGSLLLTDQQKQWLEIQKMLAATTVQQKQVGTREGLSPPLQRASVLTKVPA